ncbi:MAG: hypothetical protein JST22_21670 [Bacteroidetes bacterium]|nr:hypothetical protein [Bacteroidota bacterium]
MKPIFLPGIARHPLMLLLVLLLIVPCDIRAQSRAKHAGRDNARTVLTEWKKALKPFNPAAPTIAFTTTTEQCSGCCASAINDIVRQIDAQQWKVNVVVLVGTEYPEEIAAVRKLFNPPNIIPDRSERTSIALGARQDTPCMIVIAADGTILYRWSDIQHNYVSSAVVSALRWKVQPPATIRPAWEVRIAEAKENIILAAQSPNCVGDDLFFVDPRPNVIYDYSVVSGHLQRTFEIPDTVTFRFKRPADNPQYWTSVREHYAPLVKVEYATRPKGSDTLRVLASFHTRYDSSTMPDGKKLVMWRREQCATSIQAGNVLGIQVIKESAGYISPEIVVDSVGNFIGPYTWDDGRDQLTKEVRHDSGFVLARSSSSGAKFIPMVSFHDLEQQVKARLNPVIDPLICAGRSDTLYFFDEVNGILCRVTGGAAPSKPGLIPLWNGTALLSVAAVAKADTVALLPHAVPDIVHSDLTPTSLDAVGLSYGEGRLDLVSIEEIGPRKQSNVVVHSCALDGKITSEVAFARAGDEAVEASPIGYRDGCLMVLVKWKKARWIITGVRN